MASSLGSHAGYDYRSTGASPVESPFGRCLAPTLFSLVTIIARRGRAPSKVPSVGAWHLPCSRRRQAPSKRTPPQGETKKRRGHHAARPKGHHSARPRGALIETRTRTPYATPPPRGLSTWSDDQIVHATIRSASDGDKPRRDGELARLACWLRLSLDGGEPRRNEQHRPTGINPVETSTASRRD